MYAAADVLLLNQVGTVKDTVVPSKLLTYMAAGRPVLAAVNGSSQGAEILRHANGGIVVAPDDPDALVAGADALRKTPRSVLEAMATRNRRYAEQHFDQHKILAAHEQFIQELLHDSSHNAMSV
jgi:glycosyltransferase involved in cell wall biosynthesis